MAAITEAAAALVPIADLPSRLDLPIAEWQQLLTEQPEAIRLALLKGRAIAQQRITERLLACSGRGSGEVALFILQRDHGWPRPRRGRPPRQHPLP